VAIRASNDRYTLQSLWNFFVIRDNFYRYALQKLSITLGKDLFSGILNQYLQFYLNEKIALQSQIFPGFQRQTTVILCRFHKAHSPLPAIFSVILCKNC
jgi:hypothetical protein